MGQGMPSVVDAGRWTPLANADRTGGMKVIDQQALSRLSEDAAARPRRRANWNLHPTLDDPIQRFFNAMEPGTYVRPHRHDGANRWECFFAIRGAAAVVTFSDEGLLLDRAIIAADGDKLGLEIPPGAWHALASMEPGTVLLELKPGPYEPLTDKDFALWAPEEGSAECLAFERWYREGRLGSGCDSATISESADLRTRDRPSPG